MPREWDPEEEEVEVDGVVAPDNDPEAEMARTAAVEEERWRQRKQQITEARLVAILNSTRECTWCPTVIPPGVKHCQHPRTGATLCYDCLQLIMGTEMIVEDMEERQLDDDEDSE